MELYTDYDGRDDSVGDRSVYWISRFGIEVGEGGDGGDGVLRRGGRDGCGVVAVEPVEVGVGRFGFFVDEAAGEPQKGFAVWVGIFLVLFGPVTAGRAHKFESLDLYLGGEVDIKADVVGQGIVEGGFNHSPYEWQALREIGGKRMMEQ